MFSEELAILDRNTAKYMMDEMQSAIDGMQGTINDMQGTISGMQGTIDQQQSKLKEQEAAINKLQQESIHKTLRILRNLKISEGKIIKQITAQYQIEEEQVRPLL